MRVPMSSPKPYTPEEIRSHVRRLGWWYQSFELPGGVMTNPGDPPAYSPETRWNLIEPCVPADLTGKTVLDVGGSAGYFSIQIRGRSIRLRNRSRERRRSHLVPHDRRPLRLRDLPRPLLSLEISQPG